MLHGKPKKLDPNPARNLVMIIGVAIVRSWHQFGMNWQLTINQMTQFILEKYERERERVIIILLLLQVDCTRFNELCSKYGVKGYPTLITFGGGISLDKYNGERTLSALIAFINKQTGQEDEAVVANNAGTANKEKENKVIWAIHSYTN